MTRRGPGRPAVLPDPVALLLAVAAASTRPELERARLAAIQSGQLLARVDCAGAHSTFLGCPTLPDALGRRRFVDHGHLTLSNRLGALARTLGRPPRDAP